MTTRRNKGKRGEDLAVAALEKAGYRVVVRNWRCADGEIDVVAMHRGDVVIVEVRARVDGAEAALESITPRKRARLERLAQAYLIANELENAPFRVDVVAVDLKSASAEIIEDAVGW